MVLRRNNSQKAGCMRRSPASHCCQVRQVVCTVAPAAVCDRPAASRAARISSGVGLRAAEAARERFGWPTISGGKGKLPLREIEEAVVFNRAVRGIRNLSIGDVQFGNTSSDPVFALGADLCGEFFGEGTSLVAGGFVVEGFNCDFEVFHGVHGVSPVAPAPEARRIRRIHELNCTRNARTVNRFLQINFEGGSKPSNVEFSGEGKRSLTDSAGTQG